MSPTQKETITSIRNSSLVEAGQLCRDLKK